MMVMIMGAKANGTAKGRTLRTVRFFSKMLISPISRIARMRERLRIMARAARVRRLVAFRSLGWAIRR